jgi:magnesium transporter
MPDNPAQPSQDDTAFEEMMNLLEARQSGQALARLSALHPADQARFFARLDETARASLLPQIPRETLADILEYLEEEPRRGIVAELEPAVLGPLLDQVERDVAVDILHDLPQERAQAVLAGMARATDVAPLLVHADETAGGHMTSDFVALQGQWTVDQAVSYLRRTHPEAEQVFYLYVVDDQRRLEGVVSLRHLIVAGPGERISDLMTPDVVSVPAGEDQEETARRIQRYDFIALPVVDEERRLVGVVGVDDLIDVVEEEATEDMYRMAGLDEDESLLRPVTQSVLPRLAWLLVALISVSLAASVVNAFENTIEEVVALAVFMPVIAGLAGNAGVQTITLVVRSLALRRVELRDVRRVLTRELIIGVANGVAIGLLVGMMAFFWKENLGLAVVAGSAMLLSMTTAVAAGVLVPITLRAVRLDPALASGVLVTTFTDVVGFFFFLGLATLLLDWLT